LPLNPDSFDLAEQDFILGAIIQFSRARGLVGRYLLRVLKRVTVLDVSRDTSREKCVAANGIEHGLASRASFDHYQSVCARHRYSVARCETT